eukprot:765148-Hanusia_phi.AAC.4
MVSHPQWYTGPGRSFGDKSDRPQPGSLFRRSPGPAADGRTVRERATASGSVGFSARDSVRRAAAGASHSPIPGAAERSWQPRLRGDSTRPGCAGRLRPYSDGVTLY